MTLIFIQKPQRHFRRGPPNLQIRAPSKGSKDRRQDDTKQRDEAVGDARQEENTQRTVVRYEERQRGGRTCRNAEASASDVF